MTAALSPSKSTQSWHSANQQFLSKSLAQVRQVLEKQAGTEPDQTEPHNNTLENSYDGQPFALELLSRCFSLTEFEQNVLLLCAGAERQSAIATFIDTPNLPLIVTSRDRRRQRQPPIRYSREKHPTPTEQRRIRNFYVVCVLWCSFPFLMSNSAPKFGDGYFPLIRLPRA